MWLAVWCEESWTADDEAEVEALSEGRDLEGCPAVDDGAVSVDDVGGPGEVVDTTVLKDIDLRTAFVEGVVVGDKAAHGGHVVQGVAQAWLCWYVLCRVFILQCLRCPYRHTEGQQREHACWPHCNSVYCACTVQEIS